jgi:hypothetical protein
MSEHKVEIKGQEFTIGSPSLEKAMRLTDYVSDIMEEIPEIIDDVDNFQKSYKESHREILTLEDYSNPEMRPVFAALDIEESDFDNPDNLITDEVEGKTGIAFYKNAGQIDILVHVFPKVWKISRETLIDLCALVITPDTVMEEHDKKGALNALLKERAHFVKYNADVNDALEIVSIALILVKEQIEAASSSLGKVSNNMTQMMQAGNNQNSETSEEDSVPTSAISIENSNDLNAE